MTAPEGDDLELLRRQQEQTQALLDGTDALVFVKDLRFQYLQVNEAFARRVRRTPADCVGLTDFDLFPHALAQAYRRNDVELLRTGVRQERLVEVPALPGEDGPRTFRSAKSLLRDEHGRPWAVAGVGSDLTCEVRGQEQLRALNEELAAARDDAVAANQAKSAFLATVSHELRTPLHAVLGMLELLAQGSGDALAHQQAQVALSSGRLLLDLLNNVLDLSRGEVPDAALKPVVVDPAAVLRDIAAGVAGSALAKGLGLRLDAPQQARPVRLDPGRLRQVLLNLAGNAVKFTPRGEVVLRLRQGGEAVVFEVSDTGPGIDDTDLPGLFTAFEQGTAGRVHGGSGLGLALADQLVRQMGGRIVVTTSPAGSTFAVTLPGPPLEDGAPAPAVCSEDAAPAAGTVRSLQVLLVDDSAVNRTVGAAQLEQLGAVPVLAADGETAELLFAAQRFDLVLLDLQMPGRSGYEVARALRTLPGGDTTPVVALTASGTDCLPACLEAGMDDLATKPLSLAALEGLLGSARRRPAVPQQPGPADELDTV